MSGMVTIYSGSFDMLKLMLVIIIMSLSLWMGFVRQGE